MPQDLHSIASYWNNRADTYSVTVNDELGSDAAASWSTLFDEHLDADGKGDLRVLDVGTGPGFFARLLAERGCLIEAIDCSPDMLERAKRNTRPYHDRIAFRTMDATKLDYDDDSFDVVVTRNLTWTLPDPRQAYREWHRVLRRGGVLLNFDANWYSYLADDDIDRKRAADQSDPAISPNPEAAATDEQCAACEQIALDMPLTGAVRPAWDVQELSSIGFSRVSPDTGVWKRVWSENEQRYYASTPLFMIAATK